VGSQSLPDLFGDMPAMKKQDEISSLVWFVFALYICLESLRLPLGSWRDPGAGFLPLGSGIILGFLSLICYLQSRLMKASRMEKSWIPKERWKNLIAVLIALLGYALVFETLGFIISTFILILILLRSVKPLKWMMAIGGSAVASLACYALFQMWLKVQLPKGIIGF